jgi:uncharacterized protein (TIGR02246 family)
MRSKWIASFAPTVLAAVGIVAGLVVQGVAQTPATGSGESTEARLRRLEDKEEIRRLLVDYGRTLDQRDFEAFSKLFARDAEYVGGGGMGAIKGGAAIAKSLEDIFRQNPTGFRSPNFHLFANERIQVDGHEATALSKGIFVVPGDGNKPDMVMLATYSDILTRENGRWKFKRRVVHGDIPAPPASK